MTVDLRAMRWWDIPAVMDLERQLFTEDAWSDAMFWSELAERDSRHYVVAEDTGDVVGYAGLCAYLSGEAYVQTIAVAAGRQRHGVGTMLLSDLLDDADRRGCLHVDLEVRADNPGAIAMYARYGFRRLGVRRGYYQPSGADAVIMRRETVR
jgi:[ribosomal protein S18]-alanine N-acetyltransferase